MVYRRERYWSRYSRTYDEDAQYVVGKGLREAIAGKLRSENGLGDVVEFGCGAGYYTKAVAQHAARVIATDLSEEMLDEARKQLQNLSNVAVQRQDIENPTFPSGTFDTVLMANVLHTIETPARALLESCRILKDRGLLLVISYTDYGTTWFEKLELALRYFQKFGLPPNYYRNYSPDEVTLLVEEAGFAVEQVDLLSNTAKALYLRARKK